jgi:hypothetical protein
VESPLVALVAHGNDALAHGEAPELLASCSAFRRIAGVAFAFADGADRPPLLGTAAWLEELARRNVTRIDLVVDLRVTASASAFEGGLGWRIETRHPGHASRWATEWLHDDGPGLPLRLAFTEERALPLGLAATGDGALDAARGALDAALADAHAFSDGRGLGFGWRFADARTALHDASPRPVRHPDLLPPRGFPLAARQLVAAADRGWVFGGMGAWNDRVFDDEDEQALFERLSTNLLHTLVIAAGSGTNAYRPLAAAAG